MEKLQVLFPEPQLRRLRAIAGAQDRPVSELIRAAVDLYLARQGNRIEAVAERPPRFHCGAILVPVGELRDLANADRGGE